MEVTLSTTAKLFATMGAVADNAANRSPALRQCGPADDGGDDDGGGVLPT
jgi:hypothetical protein